MAEAFEAFKARRDGRIERLPAIRATARRLKGLKLNRRYRGRAAIVGVVIGIEGGEAIGLVGSRGKITTFYLVAGLVRRGEERVMLNGAEFTYLPLYKRARQKISYLLWEPSVFRRLTVEENLLAVLEGLGLSRQQRCLCRAAPVSELYLYLAPGAASAWVGVSECDHT